MDKNKTKTNNNNNEKFTSDNSSPGKGIVEYRTMHELGALVDRHNNLSSKQLSYGLHNYESCFEIYMCLIVTEFDRPEVTLFG